MLKELIVPVVALMAATAPAFAHEFKAGGLVIKHPWARETAAGQTAGGGFLTVLNGEGAADRLVGATSPAGTIQIHSMTMDGGVMRMRAVSDGVAVPANGTLELKPGGYHLMFTDLKAPLRKGEKVPAELEFQKAGKVKVFFAVHGIGETPGMGKGGHGAGHQGH